MASAVVAQTGEGLIKYVECKGPNLPLAFPAWVFSWVFTIT